MWQGMGKGTDSIKLLRASKVLVKVFFQKYIFIPGDTSVFALLLCQILDLELRNQPKVAS